MVESSGSRTAPRLRLITFAPRSTAQRIARASTAGVDGLVLADHLGDDQLRGERRCRRCPAVVRGGGDLARDERPVADVVVDGVADEAPRGRDLARELGMAEVDAGVDDSDEDGRQHRQRGPEVEGMVVLEVPLLGDERVVGGEQRHASTARGAAAPTSRPAASAPGRHRERLPLTPGALRRKTSSAARPEDGERPVLGHLERRPGASRCRPARGLLERDGPLDSPHLAGQRRRRPRRDVPGRPRDREQPAGHLVDRSPSEPRMRLVVEPRLLPPSAVVTTSCRAWPTAGTGVRR